MEKLLQIWTRTTGILHRLIQPDEPGTFTCEICIEPMLLHEIFQNERRCAHLICPDCVRKYIEVKLEHNIGNIPCPALNCKQMLDPISCRDVAGPRLFVKWCDVLCESTVSGLAHCYCPNRYCSALIMDECGGNAMRSKCPNCKSLFCFKCKIPWHAAFNCEELQGPLDRNDVAFVGLAERKRWKQCPQCRCFVERIEGCSSVRCRCGAYFCYSCGRHRTSGGLYCICGSDDLVSTLWVFGCVVLIISMLILLNFIFS